MIPQETITRLRQLRAIVKEADVFYYKHDTSMMPDREYDSCIAEIEAIEAEYPELVIESSPTQVVASIEVQGIPLDPPMLSLKKVYSTEEIRAWIEAIEKKLAKADLTSGGYTLEDKFDGLASSLVYTNDGIRYISTRGTGRIGEDITQILNLSTDVPRRVPVKPLEELEVRGELVMTIEEFDILNERLSPEDRYATPRHAASGVTKLKNPSESDGTLEFKAYDLVCTEHPKTQMDKFRQIAALGFELAAPKLYSIDEIEKLLADIEKENMSYEKHPFPVDGLVIKVNNCAAQRFLGATAKQPRWAIAYKFYTESHSTALLGVEWNVSRFGKHTPVGLIEPVDAYGVKISRVNLNGYQWDIPVIGTKMDVTLKGTVIPTIRCIHHLTVERTMVPVHCISCFGHINEESLVCGNGWNCPEQVIERLVHFSSRRGLNIRGLGRDTITALVKDAALTTYSDIFKLDYATLLRSLRGFKSASIYKLLNAIQAGSIISMERLVYGLGIKGLSSVEACLIASLYPNLETLLNFDYAAVVPSKITSCLGIELELFVDHNREALQDLAKYITIIK